MKDHINVTQVGAPDPTLQNSPVVEETDYEFPLKGQELSEVPVCIFNGHHFREGQYVCSGNELLRCSGGSWIRAGSCDPDNP